MLLLSKIDSEERSFGEWSMGFVDADHDTARYPGFVKLMEAKSTFWTCNLILKLSIGLSKDSATANGDAAFRTRLVPF
jgi:hypothetical protein